MKKILMITMCLFLLSACGKSAVKEETKNNETTKLIEKDTAVNDTNENSDITEVILNTGITIKKGDTIDMVNSTFYEGAYIYVGKVVNMYPETGTVWRSSRLGVAEFNYRYVVDIQATESYFDYDEENPPREPFNHLIRGVIFLNQDGTEAVHFIRTLDDTEIEEQGKYKIFEQKSYEPLKYHQVYGYEDDVSKEMREFYENR